MTATLTREQLEAAIMQARREVRFLDANRADAAAAAWRERLDNLLDEWALSR